MEKDYLRDIKIVDKMKKDGVHISFEVFPPKDGYNYAEIMESVDEIAKFKPAFMSVTYGAGGGTSKNTVAIASHIRNDLGINALAHFTCVSSTKDEIGQYLDQLKNAGIRNVLALRGDIPKGVEDPFPGGLRHASELIEEIKKHGDFCIGAACYPEGHTECVNQREDIKYLKEKVDMGVDFLTAQMCFVNSAFYSFMYRIREAGITVPVLPGIMPITNAARMKRSCELSGAEMPRRIRSIIDRFGDNPDAMIQAGIAYATEQIVDFISNGIDNIHIYTMNKPEVAEALMNNLSSIATII